MLLLCLSVRLSLLRLLILLMVQVAWQEVHHYLSSSCSKEATFRDEGGQTRQEISRGLYYSHSGRIRATRWGSEGSDVLRVWPHVSLPLGLVASCGWSEQRDCIRYQDIQYFCWTRRAQVIEYSPSTLAIWLLTFYYRYSLRTSSPIYSWWYFASSTSSTAIFGTCPCQAVQVRHGQGRYPWGRVDGKA